MHGSAARPFHALAQRHTAHSQRHSPYAEPNVERVAQRYVTTGLWLLINAGTDGLGPNEVGIPCGPEPEPAPEELRHEVPVDAAMRTGASARSLQTAATFPRRGKRRRCLSASSVRSAAHSQPRLGSRKKRRCSQCLSPMYPSHSCIIMQPHAQCWYAATWNHYDNEWAEQPVLTKQACHERSWGLDPLRGAQLLDGTT